MLFPCLHISDHLQLTLLNACIRIQLDWAMDQHKLDNNIRQLRFLIVTRDGKSSRLPKNCAWSKRRNAARAEVMIYFENQGLFPVSLDDLR